MSESTEFEKSTSRFGASLAVAVAVVGGLVVAAAVGVVLPALLGFGGALVVARSAATLDTADNEHRAVGSVGVVVGSAVVAAALALAPAGTPLGVFTCVVLGVTLAGFDATVGLDTESGTAVAWTLVRSLFVLFVGCVLGLALHLNAFGALGHSTWRLGRALSGSTALTNLFVLELACLSIVLLLGPALARVDQWVPDARLPEWRTLLGSLAANPAEIPRGVWVLLGAQFLFVVEPWGHRWFDRFLTLLSIPGDVIRFLLTSGVLHLALGSVLAVLVAIVVGDYLRFVLVSMVGSNPPRTLAGAAGGFVVAALVLPLGGAARLLGVIPRVPPLARSNAVAEIGLGTAALGATLLAAFGMLALVAVALMLTESRFVPPAAGGFAIGSVLLFVAALGAAAADAPAIATFVGVGTALLVWDLGENAVGLGQQLGVVADTRRGEATHATGSVLVVAGGVGLAAVAMYGLGPLSVPSAGRALVALVLALVALLAFVLAIDRDDDAAEGQE